ncbi:MAG: DUF222 domain-containing protein, partial [Phycicoccus sp.]
RSGAYLSTRFVASAELTSYELVMTPEQAATLEAAIGPLSKPQPNEDTKEADRRPAGQRRVEALTEVCRRSASIDADSAGADGAAGSPSAVHVTIPLADLQQVTGYAEVLGSVAAETILGPGQLRKIACDAALIPYVLGSDGEVVDQGMVVRLYTRAQRRRLWLRDRHCTYLGCSIPATWCRAHHVRHWADAGPTDLHNAALLCERHHTVVHARRLWAQVRDKPDEHGRYVVWDLHDGSYDRALAAIRDREVRDEAHQRRRADALARILAIPEARHAHHEYQHALTTAEPDPWDPAWDQIDAGWHARPIDDNLAEPA